jgi:hypothetical protein
MYDSGVDQGASPTSVSASLGIGSPLTQLLLAAEIVPGEPPGYELCKTIHAYHPLGSVLADAPVTRAQNKPREINVPVPGEQRIVEQFNKTWRELGGIGATIILHNLIKTSRIYGIASLGVGERGKANSEPLDIAKIADADLYFNILDPLNTAGSLVLNQDPNSPDFLKPDNNIRVSGDRWHTSRLYVKMNEQPLYIEWTKSAFGFVGRSVYQRALYPLKTFLQSMITDQMVVQKSGLLVAKMKTPGSFIDNVMSSMFGWKRGQIKAGVTGQVLQIGVDEEIETLNMQNLDKAFTTARNNVIKNIASAVGMPASIVAQETLTEGFGEGTEDAKKEVEYLEYIREDMQPAYDFMDRVVMRKAWTKEFYATLKAEYPELKPYDTWLYESIHAFKANWTNLLIEPESEKIKTEEIQFKSVIAVVETIAPLCDPETKANLIEWAADNLNSRERLFASKLIIDADKLQEFLEENRETQMQQSGKEGPEGKPRPFSAAS